nr:MAG TPA: hypothetical protein [Caudoviricetes sp.]
MSFYTFATFKFLILALLRTITIIKNELSFLVTHTALMPNL